MQIMWRGGCARIKERDRMQVFKGFEEKVIIPYFTSREERIPYEKH
jgi:hypothetical protein